MTTERAFGWEPDPRDGDKLDWPLRLGGFGGGGDADLTWQSPPIMSQGRNSSCVAQVVAGLIYSAHRRQGVAEPELLSRARLWWLMRFERRMQDFNVGGWLRQAFRICHDVGFCRERHFEHSRTVYDATPPIMIDRFERDQGEKWATTNGRKPIEFRRIKADPGPDRVAAFREALAAGFQIGAGWDVPKRFSDGRFDPTSPYEMLPGEDVHGRHAMRLVASVPGGFLVDNSWGERFGKNGRFVMSHEEAGKGGDPWVVVSAPNFSDEAA